MKYKGLARGVKYEDVVIVVGSADAIILVSVALVVKAEIVGFVLSGLLQVRRVRSGVRREWRPVVVCV